MLWWELSVDFGVCLEKTAEGMNSLVEYLRKQKYLGNLCHTQGNTSIMKIARRALAASGGAGL